MVNSVNDKNEHQELLDKVLFSYIGFQHVQNLAQELNVNKMEIDNIKVPESLESWFTKFNNDFSNSERKSKYKSKFKNIVTKAAMIFLVLALSMTVLTVSVDAFRIRALNLIMENKGKYLDISIDEENPVENGMNLDSKGYSPNYLPKELEISNIEIFGETTIITYTNDNNDSIMFNQAPIGANYQIDSENAELKDIDINGIEGIAIMKEGFTTLFWNNQEYGFILYSNIEIEELLKVAESLVLNN